MNCVWGVACRKAILILLRKMVHYASPAVLQQLCAVDFLSINFGSQLVQVIAIVLDSDVSVSICYGNALLASRLLVRRFVAG